MFINEINQKCIKGKTIFLAPYVEKDGHSKYEIISPNFHHIISSANDQITIFNKINQTCETLSLHDYINKYSLNGYKNILVLPYYNKNKTWNASALQIMIDFSPLIESAQIPLYKKDRIIREGENKISYEKTTIFNVKELRSYNKKTTLHTFPEFANFYRNKALFFPIPGIYFPVLKVPPSRILDHDKLSQFYSFADKCLNQKINYTQSKLCDKKLENISKIGTKNNNTFLIMIGAIAIVLFYFGSLKTLLANLKRS